jgi:hypothetical protein
MSINLTAEEFERMGMLGNVPVDKQQLQEAKQREEKQARIDESNASAMRKSLAQKQLHLMERRLNAARAKFQSEFVNEEKAIEGENDLGDLSKKKGHKEHDHGEGTLLGDDAEEKEIAAGKLSKKGPNKAGGWAKNDSKVGPEASYKPKGDDGRDRMNEMADPLEDPEAEMAGDDLGADEMGDDADMGMEPEAMDEPAVAGGMISVDDLVSRFADMVNDLAGGDVVDVEGAEEEGMPGDDAGMEPMPDAGMEGGLEVDGELPDEADDELQQLAEAYCRKNIVPALVAKIKARTRQA